MMDSGRRPIRSRPGRTRPPSRPAARAAAAAAVVAAKRTFFCHSRAKPNALKNDTRVSRSPGENTAAANGRAENDDVLDRFSRFSQQQQSNNNNSNNVSRGD